MTSDPVPQLSVPQPPVPQRTVRLAWAADVPAIAGIQLGALRATLPAQVAEDLAVEDVAAAWRAAVTRPPTARHRVLVATEDAHANGAAAAPGGPPMIAPADLGTAGGATVVGFTATAPAEDPDATAGEDGEVIALHTDRPDDGLTAALLAAAADTLEADGFTRGQLWVSTNDDGLRRVAAEAGWVADGAYRQLDLGDAADGPGGVPGGELAQVRLHTGLTEPEDGTASG